MKSKFTILLLSVMFFSLISEILPLTFFPVSSVGPAGSGLMSASGMTMPMNVESVQNFASSVNITGNLVVSGNNVTRLAGISPSLPARVYLNGSILVQGNGTLILQYVRLYFVAWKSKSMASPDYSRNIVVADPVTVGLGQSSVFVSQVSGGVPPYQYQWYFNNSAVLGANSSTWVFTPTSVGTYQAYVQVVDSLGVTVQSGLQLVTVTPEPSVKVAVSPASALVYLGNSVVFSSSIIGGTAPYLYQWYLNGNPVSGATQSGWTFTPASNGDYQVYVVVKDSLNAQGTSSIVPVSVSSPPPPPSPLSVTINPASSNASLGHSAAFVSQVSGGVPPYQYQWYLDSTSVSGATNPTWVFTPASTGVYEIYVEVTDAASVAVQSAPARLVVTPSTTIKVTASPSSAVTSVGGSVAFTATVTGNSTKVSYYWYLNGKQASIYPTWVFTPTSKGDYSVYLIVKDRYNAQGTSNVVPVSVYSVSVTTSPAYGIGRPRLVISNATIASLTYTSQTYGGKAGDVSLGCAIYARGNGEITGKELKFYRSLVHPDSARVGKPCVLNCSDESVVSLSYCTVDLIASYDNAHVAIYQGNGPRMVTLRSGHDRGIGFQACDSSRVDIYGVDFNNATVSGNASMSLAHCAEMGSCTIWTMDNANVYFSDGTALTGSSSSAGLNVAGNSHAILNSSVANAGASMLIALSAIENGTISMTGNCSVLGTLVFSGNSRASAYEVLGLNAFRDMKIRAYDFSNVSFSNCVLFGSGLTYTYSLEFYNSSHFSCAGTKIWFCQVKLFNNASFYTSNSTLTACRVLVNDFANVTFADRCKIENTIEVRDNSQIAVESSSSVRIVFGSDSARVSVVNAKISMLDLKDISKLRAENSTIEDLILTASNVAVAWTGLGNFFENRSLTLSGHSPNITLLNTFVHGLDLMFLGDSQVSIHNSTIGNLGLQDSCVVRLSNVSAIWESVSVLGNAKLYVSSLLRVRTVDYFGNPISGANVTAQRIVSGKTDVLKRLTADKDGWVSFVLPSEFVNASGRFPVLNVIVKSEFHRVSNSEHIDMAMTNKDLTVSLPLPSWSMYILPAVLILAAILVLVVLSFANKKLRKSR